MLKAGTRPSQMVTRGFWFVILEHCEAKADADGFAVGRAGLRRNVELTSAGAEWGGRLLSGYEQTLQRLRQR